MTPKQIDDIIVRSHAPGTQQARYVSIRDKAQELAQLIHEACPESREKSMALRQLGQAMANTSIAINKKEA